MDTIIFAILAVAVYAALSGNTVSAEGVEVMSAQCSTHKGVKEYTENHIFDSRSMHVLCNDGVSINGIRPDKP